MNVKLGICNFCVPGTGIFAPRFVAEAGLAGMSIEYGNLDHGFPLSNRKVQEAYLDEQQRYGIAYANIGCSGFDFIPFHVRKDDPLYPQIRIALRKVVEVAAFMKIPMIFVPGFHKSAISCEEDMVCAANMFRYLCELSGEKDILVSYENKLNAAEQIRFVEMVDMKNFGLFYDSNNYFYEKGYDQVSILEDTFPYLSPQMHVKDGKKGYLASSLLGQGDANFYGVIDALKRRDYEGWLILENLYELQTFSTFGKNDVFELFLEDVRILKDAVK